MRGAGRKRETAPAAVVVLVTGPDVPSLEVVGRRLVQERLAACVNIVPGLTSVYRWKGAVQTDSEALALVKTTPERVHDVQRRVLELHPYDVPEVLVLPAEGGSDDYIRWIASSVAQGAEDGAS